MAICTLDSLNSWDVSLGFWLPRVYPGQNERSCVLLHLGAEILVLRWYHLLLFQGSHLSIPSTAPLTLLVSPGVAAMLRETVLPPPPSASTRLG